MDEGEEINQIERERERERENTVVVGVIVEVVLVVTCSTRDLPRLGNQVEQRVVET